jgi:formylglycine-generating enzyme required for sulfatase activity
LAGLAVVAGLVIGCSATQTGAGGGAEAGGETNAARKNVGWTPPPRVIEAAREEAERDRMFPGERSKSDLVYDPAWDKSMAFVPAGTFVTGCPATDASASGKDEGAGGSQVQTVYLNAFKIDWTEVTQRDYARCLDAGKCIKPDSDWDPEKYADFPVVWVSWWDAMLYCMWVGKRLPTALEWEKAARGTDGRQYPWGNGPPTADLVAPWSSGQAGIGGAGPLPVCSKAPAGNSPYGLCDMAGNVAEWTQPDCEERGPAHVPLGNAAVSNCVGATVMGGGSTSMDAERIESCRGWMKATGDVDRFLGFRCALSVPDSPAPPAEPPAR